MYSMYVVMDASSLLFYMGIENGHIQQLLYTMYNSH